MQYCSTRGEVHGWSFRDVLFSGYAPDGGMFMPEEIPILPPATLRSWSSLSYQQLVCEVCSLFIPEQLIPRHDLEALISSALSKFTVPDAVRMVKLKDSVSILELFHGETLAFKDLAMMCTTRFLEYFLSKESRHATILVGTSGDTGGSAISSACGLNGVDVVVVFPRGRITMVQEKQMTTHMEDNVHVFAADGSSDEIDVPLRKLFTDLDLVKSHGLMSLNSGELVTNSAGCIVKRMGIPLRLVAVVNSNDILHRAVQNGDFSMAQSVKQTLAPAIDIQDPYNMERVFWLLSGEDGALVKDMMEQFQKTHRLTLPETLHKELCSVLSSGSVSDEGIMEAMVRCWKENQYLVCPHTAVALCHHYRCPIPPGEKRCCIATASPAKFLSAVQKAGLSLDLPEALKSLETKETRCKDLERGEDWEAALRECITAIGSARQRGEPFYA
uniref:Threonine synthase-like 2 n=1 Tax=Astyanax mexicanus TaxID=7994 RepID=A0A3B1JMP8_ASTMX